MRVMAFHWWTVLLPTVAIIAVDYARHELLTGWMHPWWEEGALLAGVFAVTLGTSLLLSSRVERSRRRERESETLRRIGMEITSTLELNATLASVLRNGREILGVDCLGIAVADSPQRELMVQTRGAPAPKRMRAQAGMNLVWEAIATGENQEVARLTPLSAEGACMFSRHCLAFPLRMGSQVLGGLCVGTSRSRPPNPDDRRLAEQLAHLASVAIANALLHDRARNLATLEERDRIAREMHDSLAQVLGYLSMKAASARDLVARSESVRLDAELVEMKQVADEAYMDVREAILGLRSSARTSGGLLVALEEYLQKFSRQAGVSAQLQVQDGQAFSLPPRSEIQLVRVIQEALTNVRKHARAGSVRVKLEKDDRQVRVTIQDDGQGFQSSAAAKPSNGYGLLSMQERLAGLGGRLNIASVPGRGTTVTAWVPLAVDGEVPGGEG